MGGPTGGSVGLDSSGLTNDQGLYIYIYIALGFRGTVGFKAQVPGIWV